MLLRLKYILQVCNVWVACCRTSDGGEIFDFELFYPRWCFFELANAVREAISFKRSFQPLNEEKPRQELPDTTMTIPQRVGGLGGTSY